MSDYDRLSDRALFFLFFFYYSSPHQTEADQI